MFSHPKGVCVCALAGAMMPWGAVAVSAQQAGKPADKNNTKVSEKTTVRSEERLTLERDYREVSSFFNVREANANVKQGEWEFEVPFGWVTQDEEDDDFSIGASLKYGFTDNLYAELELIPLNLGDGGDQGNGDLELTLFNRFWGETETLPAFAMLAAMRIPSGDGSSGVDGELHFNLTKTLVTNFRAHLEGFIETANGAPGGEEEENRRDFQWGIGPGFDYQFNDRTIGILNYLNRSSEENGHSNQNLLELGVAQEITHGQHLKAAIDIGLDGHEETPNFGAKLQWSIEF